MLSALVQNKLTGAWLNLRLPISANLPRKINRFPEFKPASAPSGTRPSEKLSDEQIVEKLEICMARLMGGDDFSGTVLLARNGKLLFNKAYGLSNREDQSPNRTDTKFNIASMGKMFTGVAVAQLAEQGKLSFDDPLDKYLAAEWLNPEISRRIKVKHLLTHTSGLGDYFIKLREQPDGVVFRKLEDYRPLVADESPAFEPGTKWAYSNTGMLLAGVVIEQVTGGSYFDYVRDHIYKPAGMTNTDAYDKDGPEPNKATGYVKIFSDKGVQWMSSTGERVMKGMPSGGSFSTVEDLLNFDIALRNHKLLSPELTEIVLSAKPEISSPFYGYGFNLSECDAGRIAEHGGDGTGIQSSFRMYLESGYTVAVLSNRSAPAASIVDNVINQLINSR
jgi:CubicO group peptidase (beta-lactamase class C family)